MNSRSLIVELTGYGGVGKTELCRRVQANLQQSGVQCSWLSPKIRNDSDDVARDAKVFRGTLAKVSAYLTIAKARPRNLRYLRKYAAKYAWLQCQYRRVQQGTGIYLVDEGMFQTILGLYMCSRHTLMVEIAEAVLGNANVPNLVVTIEASEATVEQRRALRQRPNENVVLAPVEKEAVAELRELVRDLELRRKDMLFASEAYELIGDAEFIAKRISHRALVAYRARLISSSPRVPAATTPELGSSTSDRPES